ncbi:MAG: MATE family efflux transporter [Pseudomonadota bacterium]
MSEAKFLEGSLMRHVVVMSTTASLGLMAVFLVDFIDMIFISMLGQAELAAAIGYAGAILFFTTSISIGLAIAAGAVVARALGAGEDDRARVLSSHAMAAGAALAMVFAAIVWLSLEPLTQLVGAQGETQRLAVGYLAVIIPSMPILAIGMIGGAILRAHGDAGRAMTATLAGGAVNAVLDPIFIFGFGLDLTGAAMASVAARFAIMGASLYPIFRHYGGFAPVHAKALIADIRQLSAIAFPAMATNVATPISTAYVTREMAVFGEAAVAGMAIIARLVPVTFAVVFALSGAIGPIVGQNFGAGRFDRVRRAFYDSVLFTGVYVVFAAVILFFLRGPLAALFNAEGEALTLIYLFCGPLALAWFFNGVIFISNAAFNNLGHPLHATAINWGRHTIGTVPPVMLGAALLGPAGVLIGQAVGGVVFAAIAWAMTLRLVAQAEAAGEQQERRERPHFSRRARLVQLFEHRR